MTVQSLPDRDPHPIPAAVLRAAGTLIALTLIGVGAARLAGAPPAAMPPQVAEADSRMIAIATRAGGGVIVSDAETGGVIADLDMMHAGFIAGVDRALDRERMKRGLARDLPVRVVRWTDGRMSLLDPATGWRAELKGFGPDNLQAFARLLD